MSKSFDVSDEEARSDEKTKALGVMKCQEASTNDETNKVEEFEPAGLATGEKRWEFCKRLAKGDKIYEEVKTYEGVASAVGTFHALRQGDSQ